MQQAVDDTLERGTLAGADQHVVVMGLDPRRAIAIAEIADERGEAGVDGVGVPDAAIAALRVVVGDRPDELNAVAVIDRAAKRLVLPQAPALVIAAGLEIGRLEHHDIHHHQADEQKERDERVHQPANRGVHVHAERTYPLYDNTSVTIITLASASECVKNAPQPSGTPR